MAFAVGLAAWVVCLTPAAAAITAAGPLPLPGFGRTCEILLAFPEGPDIEAIEQAIGLDHAARRVIGKQGDHDLVLRYTRSDGLVATFGVRFYAAEEKTPRDRFVYAQSQVIRMGNKIWIHWRRPDYKTVDYFGFTDGAPRGCLPFDPLADWRPAGLERGELLREVDRRRCRPLS